MKRSWLTGVLTGAIVGVAAFAFTESIDAQGGHPGAGGRIACVNVKTVFDEYQRRKDLDDEMTELQDQFRIEEEQRRTKIDTLQAEIDRLDPTDPTARERLGELRRMTVEYRIWGELKQADMGGELARWSLKIYGEILDTVSGVAEREGYDMVFYKGQFEPTSMDFEALSNQIRDHKLLYAHASVDLTQVVLTALHDEYRKQPRQKMLYVP